MKTLAELSANEREAVRLLGIYTNRNFDCYSLSGSARASVRAHIMSALRGVRVPQAKSGVNALRDAMFVMSGVTGSCLAAQETNFIEWTRNLNVDRS